MQSINEEEILAKLRFDNPWWNSGRGIDKSFEKLPRRAYAQSFFQLVQQKSVNRAVILMGPRRVGKTVMVLHAIQELLNKGLPGNQALYISMETPIFTGRTLSQIVESFTQHHGHSRDEDLYIFFDEIQYLKDWEIHLKALVDSYPAYKFVATGSAAAALRLKSIESGAGRFTDFMLPPLTFFEYLRFVNAEESLIIPPEKESEPYDTTDIELLNKEFIDYMNIGGYPEAVFSQEVRADTSRYIRSDIIDKVLLRDLPQLYGIQNIQDLNQLFTFVAYNTGTEFNLEDLSKESSINKGTLKRYLEYLEAAFLIKRVDRVDKNAKHFQRARTFKIYLTNPSMRSALFAPVSDGDPPIGHLAETAIFSQWVHMPETVANLRYARWSNKHEVDLVSIDDARQKARWAVEVKWSDRPARDESCIYALIELAKRSKLPNHSLLITTKTYSGFREISGIQVRLLPSSLYCYTVGRNGLNRRQQHTIV